MGLLDGNPAEQTPGKDDYQFVSGDIAEFMNDYKRPKQDQPIDETDGLDDFTQQPDDQELEDKPLENLKARVSVANATGSLLATALDAGISTILGTVIAKGNPSDFKADEEQKEELTLAISEYVKLKGGDIPPGVALIIVILSIYGPKTGLAIQMRKFNEREEELKDKIRELENQLGKTENKTE